METAHLYEDQTSSKKDDRPGLAAGLKVLTDQGATFDTTTAASKLVFGIFAALADFKLELISERAMAGMASARAGAAWAAGSLLWEVYCAQSWESPARPSTGMSHSKGSCVRMG